MAERMPLTTRGADPASLLLIEKRCEIYSRAATQIMDLEEALDEDDGLRARYLLHDLRRTLRGGLAFLTDQVYRELERLEVISDLLPAQEGPVPQQAQAQLADRLQLLHVKLARSLKLPVLQDLEQIVQLPTRLKHKLDEEERELDAQFRRRKIEEQGWAYENEARELIRTKQYGKAVKSLKKAIRLDGTRAVFQNDLGVVLSLLGRNREAVDAYRTAVALNERHAAGRTDEWTTSYYNLGIALRKAAQQALEAADPSALELVREGQLAFQEYVRLNATGAKVVEARRVLTQLEALVAELEAPAPQAPPTAPAVEQQIELA